MGEGKNPSERSPTWMDEEHEEEWAYRERITHSGFIGPSWGGGWLAYHYSTFSKAVWVFKPHTGTEEEEE